MNRVTQPRGRELPAPPTKGTNLIIGCERSMAGWKGYGKPPEEDMSERDLRIEMRLSRHFVTASGAKWQKTFFANIQPCVAGWKRLSQNHEFDENRGHAGLRKR